MNRELKFRIYSFLDKSFIYFDIYNYPSGIAGGVSEPQQYTGLKDKNGTEIYECDIIESIIEENSERGERDDRIVKNKFVVGFHRGCFGKLPYELYKPAELLLPHTQHWAVKKYDVIGNIFENPELLKNS